MDAQSLVTVSVPVVLLTQILKWGGVPLRWAPVAILLLSAVGVGVWVYSQGQITRADLWSYFAGWVSVSVSAAGVFGFAKDAAEEVTRIRAS